MKKVLIVFCGALAGICLQPGPNNVFPCGCDDPDIPRPK